MTRSSVTILLALLVLPLFFYSCDDDEAVLLERELLFRMDIGKMEDQLFVQQIDGVNTSAKTRILMKDGFFLVSNGESGKVMEFNSFGDLIRLFYNGDMNPDPVILSPEIKTDLSVTRSAAEYPLKDPGEIAVALNGDILIDDLAPELRQEYDEQRNVRLDRIILRFSEDGRLLSYLGQEGPGGTPFPYIQSVAVNSTDEICVVTRNPGGWYIFWFTRMGDPLYRIDFTAKLLPDTVEGATASIDNIFPDYQDRVLYLKVDYYIKDQAGNMRFSKSVIHSFDLDQEKYTAVTDVPRNIVKSEQPVIFEQKEHEYLYEFAGVVKGPYFFLISPYEGTVYRLTILAGDGSLKGRALIDFSDREIFFRSYQINPEGIFSAVVCGEYDAEVVWWRTDRLIGEQENVYSQFLPNERD